jgi:6-phosphogluconate dehydrogenase
MASRLLFALTIGGAVNTHFFPFSLQVVAFNRTVEKVDHFLQNEAKGSKVVGAHSIEDMCKKLKKPRRVMVIGQVLLMIT